MSAYFPTDSIYSQRFHTWHINEPLNGVISEYGRTEKCFPIILLAKKRRRKDDSLLNTVISWIYCIWLYFFQVKWNGEICLGGGGVSVFSPPYILAPFNGSFHRKNWKAFRQLPGSFQPVSLSSIFRLLCFTALDWARNRYRPLNYIKTNWAIHSPFPIFSEVGMKKN